MQGTPKFVPGERGTHWAFATFGDFRGQNVACFQRLPVATDGPTAGAERFNCVMPDIPEPTGADGPSRMAIVEPELEHDDVLDIDEPITITLNSRSMMVVKFHVLQLQVRTPPPQHHTGGRSLHGAHSTPRCVCRCRTTRWSFSQRRLTSMGRQCTRPSPPWPPRARRWCSPRAATRAAARAVCTGPRCVCGTSRSVCCCCCRLHSCCCCCLQTSDMANKIAVLLEYVELNVPRDKRAGYVQRINVFNGWLVALEFDTWLSRKGTHLRSCWRANEEEYEALHERCKISELTRREALHVRPPADLRVPDDEAAFVWTRWQADLYECIVGGPDYTALGKLGDSIFVAHPPLAARGNLPTRTHPSPKPDRADRDPASPFRRKKTDGEQGASDRAKKMPRGSLNRKFTQSAFKKANAEAAAAVAAAAEATATAASVAVAFASVAARLAE